MAKRDHAHGAKGQEVVSEEGVREEVIYVDAPASNNSTYNVKQQFFVPRFPCYVMENNTEFAVTRHSVPETERYLLVITRTLIGAWKCNFLF